MASGGNWTRQLHRNVKANHILLADETSRDNTTQSAAIAAHPAASSIVGLESATRGEHPPSSLPKKPVKRQTIFP